MITFKQQGDTLQPFWTDGREVTATDWKKISAGVKRHYQPTTIRAIKTIEVSVQEEQLTDLLYHKIKENFDFLVPKPTPAKEYLEMNKLHRIDGRDYATIAFIINWCQEDKFWKGNIRSVAKLRKQFETLLIQASIKVQENRQKVAVI